MPVGYTPIRSALLGVIVNVGLQDHLIDVLIRERLNVDLLRAFLRPLEWSVPGSEYRCLVFGCQGWMRRCSAAVFSRSIVEKRT